MTEYRSHLQDRLCAANRDNRDDGDIIEGFRWTTLLSVIGWGLLWLAWRWWVR